MAKESMIAQRLGHFGRKKSAAEAPGTRFAAESWMNCAIYKGKAEKCHPRITWHPAHQRLIWPLFQLSIIN
jgi:hypothetical protein